ATERELRVGKAKRFTGHGRRNSGDFEENDAGTDHRDPKLGAAFPLPHTGFGGFLRDRFVRENANPDFTFTLHVTRDGNTGGFDLGSGHPTAIKTLNAIFAE